MWKAIVILVIPSNTLILLILVPIEFRHLWYPLQWGDFSQWLDKLDASYLNAMNYEVFLYACNNEVSLNVLYV